MKNVLNFDPAIPMTELKETLIGTDATFGQIEHRPLHIPRMAIKIDSDVVAHAYLSFDSQRVIYIESEESTNGNMSWTGGILHQTYKDTMVESAI